jgi:uncharacterized protein DUF3313
MIRIQGVAFIALVAFLGGCSSTFQAKHVQPSDFLSQHHAKLETATDSGTLQGYRNPRVDWTAYRKVILKPVILWEGFSSQLKHEQQEDLQRLADSFYEMLYLKLAKDYDVVEQPTDGAMLIQVAITHAEKSWIVPAFLSKASLELQILNTLWTFASGKPAFAGEVTVEFKAQDAHTGELLIAGADRRVGGRNLLDKEVFNSWGDVKNSLEFWTDLSAYRLCVLRGETSCVQPKA